MSLLPRIIKQIKSNMTAINRNNAFQNLNFTHIQYQLALKDLFAITSANYGLCHVQSKQTTIRYVSSTLKFIPKKSDSITLFTPNPFLVALVIFRK